VSLPKRKEVAKWAREPKGNKAMAPTRESFLAYSLFSKTIFQLKFKYMTQVRGTRSSIGVLLDQEASNRGAEKFPSGLV
jgi:hypothetical protein